jgi:hypothetical protein
MSGICERAFGRQIAQLAAHDLGRIFSEVVRDRFDTDFDAAQRFGRIEITKFEAQRAGRFDS